MVGSYAVLLLIAGFVRAMPGCRACLYSSTFVERSVRGGGGHRPPAHYICTVWHGHGLAE